MNYLSFEHISKSYGDQVLFNDISLNINKGQKVALIARNGSGKTSLLRILANEESPEGEKARILKHPNVRIGYLMQEPVFNDEMEVLDTALDGPGEKIKAIRSYESALQSGDNERIQKQIEQIERLKAWDAEAMVREVLDRLEVGRFDQKVGTLSGGQRKRLSLARLLINEPDFLILDEPTNHLDLEMIEWLEDFLKQPNLTLLLVTHDRYFMERICDTIVELDGGKLYKYLGSYADYLEKKTAREENEAIRLDKSKKLLKTELEWVRRQPKARGTKAKSRVQKFEELRTEVGGVRAKDEMELEIAPTRLGSKIAELQYISKSYGGKPLIKDFHYKFRKRDRVGVVGPNGSGKSTFLKILTAQIKPDGGKVIIGETVQFGYYTQDGISLKQDKRVIDVVRDIAEYIPMTKGQKITAATLLERFMFPRPQQQVYVSQLSGGEKRRLYLVTVLMKNPNFLILDEPTNDLDIFTLNALEDYLVDFPGCLVIVSHDRFFMDKLVDHLFVFEGEGEIRDFPGNYSQYREFADEQLDLERRQKEEERAITSMEKSGSSDWKQQKVLKNQLRKLEREIDALQERKKEIENIFLHQVPNPDEISKLASELESIKADIEGKEMEWMDTAEDMENFV